ncbi:MAG: 2-succinyl-6-hydroxy-2,4-cyclohexadiene-1-carboxylate synthase [Bacteroidetes bacterium]|nr:2-succinyl-6-hydroxy-2,4-cyclohexadiene-1-carboxylate synthase [Bacteroidota bacterium]MBU1115677.1 2-succinyl-6-hydroxy-2,4-cyclohexadiene-1-carboxylate synthase [Bacteroidota bacterium]MBU1799010.1 2-succinyl-6-hydroxy-2,4-cyclohexadiene-1-carboxylate synthase [Bacteroidota bacterium]
MEFSIDGITVNVICEDNSVPLDKIPIVFLHGFTGCANDWLFLFDKLNPKFFPIAIDLPGHGKSIVPNNLEFFSAKSYTNIVSIVLNKLNIKKTILVGYSMGGRTALSFAVENSEKVLALILESSTAGIENQNEKTSRIKTDYQLADKIISDGIDAFTEYWMNLAFFTSLKSLNDKDYSKIIESKKRNSPEGLSNSLKGFSTGKMPSLWNKLNSIRVPTLLIAGSLDSKYRRLNKEMNFVIPNSEIKIIENCGHNIHLEKPEEFTILVNEFLNKIK